MLLQFNRLESLCVWGLRVVALFKRLVGTSLWALAVNSIQLGNVCKRKQHTDGPRVRYWACLKQINNFWILNVFAT